MLDIAPILYNKLNGICGVSLQFPQGETKLPHITLSEIGNTSNLVIDNKEIYSIITYQVDVWDNGNTPQSCNELSVNINDVMIDMGFSREFSHLIHDNAGLQRRTMRFSTKIDNNNLRTYKE